MARKLYPTDLSERQWHILKPLIPAPLASGRTRTVDMRFYCQRDLLHPYQRLRMALATS